MTSLAAFQDYILKELTKFERVAQVKKAKKESQNKLTYFFTHSDRPNYEKELNLAKNLKTVIASFDNVFNLIKYLRAFIENNFYRKVSRTVASALAVGVGVKNFNKSEPYVLAYLLDDIDLKIKQTNFQPTYPKTFKTMPSSATV